MVLQNSRLTGYTDVNYIKYAVKHCSDRLVMPTFAFKNAHPAKAPSADFHFQQQLRLQSCLMSPDTDPKKF